jgi:hypothetical protein
MNAEEATKYLERFLKTQYIAGIMSHHNHIEHNLPESDLFSLFDITYSLLKDKVEVELCCSYCKSVVFTGYKHYTK